MREERTSTYHLANIIPERITYARELRGLTKKALSESIGKSPSAITQFETGMKPDITTFIAICSALNLPASFFSNQSNPQTPDSEHFHFRARASVTQGMKTQSRRYAERIMDLYLFLEDFGVFFPRENVTAIAQNISLPTTPDELSASVRKLWGLTLNPIHNLFSTLEKSGIFIIILESTHADLEAFATWFGNRPCIAISDTNKIPASRIQFDLAHELGHLLLHDEETPETIKEPEAHAFAGAFLMPKQTYSLDSPTKWSLGAFVEIKKTWHVSIAAALRRSKDIGAISESSYKWGMVDLSKKGLRMNEPNEFPKYKPTLLAQALSAAAGHLNMEDIASAMNMHTTELEAMLKTQFVPQETIQQLYPKRSPAKIISFSPRK